MAKWNTRTKALLTGLCPFMKPFLKYTPSSPLCATEKLQFNNYSALFFQFNGNWSPEMQFCVIYLETSANTQPLVAFWSSNFIFILLFLAECLIQCKGQCLLCLASVVGASLSLCLCFSGWGFSFVLSLFQWMGLPFLSFLVVWVSVTLPISYIRSLTIVSFNRWYIILKHKRREW